MMHPIHLHGMWSDVEDDAGTFTVSAVRSTINPEREADRWTAARQANDTSPPGRSHDGTFQMRSGTSSGE